MSKLSRRTEHVAASPDTLARIADASGVSVLWLMLARGPVENTPTRRGMLRTHPDWPTALAEAKKRQRGIPEDFWRIAVSVRIFGDDIVWDPRPDCVNLAGISFDEMIQGERPRGALCPLVWSEDGRRDGDGDYPRGFATGWNRARKSDINEYALFAQNLAASQRAKPQG